ncbi:hypothetical protein FB107DRAFT_253867, partial [Schizophyllum commune]
MSASHLTSFVARRLLICLATPLSQTVMSSAWNISRPRRTSMATSDGLSSPPSVWSDNFHSRSTYFSSPPRSSSPPTSPMTSYSRCDSVHIQSSPLAPDYKSLGRASRPTRRDVSPTRKPSAGKITLPSFRTMFGGDDLPPLTSSSTSSGYYADDSTMSADDASEDAEGPGYDSVFFSDEEVESEGEDVYEDEITGLSYRRTSYFQTSAERGRWKYEPVVPRSSHQPRKSEPSITMADNSTSSTFARPASEPAPITVALSPFMTPPEAATATEADSSPESPPSPAADDSPIASTPPQDTSPESPDEIDDPMLPSSPLLPPTSPLSEDENAPVSPLSLSHQSTPASITVEASCVEAIVVDLEVREIVEPSAAMDESLDPLTEVQIEAATEVTPTEQDSPNDVPVKQEVVPAQQPLRPSASCQISSVQSKPNADLLPKVLAGDKENHVHDVLPCPAKRTKSRSPMFPCEPSTPSRAPTPPPAERHEHVAEPAPVAKADARITEEPTNDTGSSSEKRKTDDADPGPARKRSRQTLSPEPERASSPLSEEEEEEEEVRPPPKKSTKARSKKRSTKSVRGDSMAATSDGETDEPAPKPQRPTRKRRTTLEKLSDTTFADQPSLPPSTYKRAKPQPPPEPSGPSPDDEVRGMLIQSMAASRASSQTLTTLCRAVLEAYPHLLDKQAEDMWHTEFASVLERGAEQAGLFGKVESSYQ